MITYRLQSFWRSLRAVTGMWSCARQPCVLAWCPHDQAKWLLSRSQLETHWSWGNWSTVSLSHSSVTSTYCRHWENVLLLNWRSYMQSHNYCSDLYIVDFFPHHFGGHNGLHVAPLLSSYMIVNFLSFCRFVQSEKWTWAQNCMLKGQFTLIKNDSYHVMMI